MMHFIEIYILCPQRMYTKHTEMLLCDVTTTYPYLACQHLSRETKVRLLNILVLSVLLYGVEMWTLTSAQEKDSMPSILNIFARLRVSFSEISH